MPPLFPAGVAGVLLLCVLLLPPVVVVALLLAGVLLAVEGLLSLALLLESLPEDFSSLEEVLPEDSLSLEELEELDEDSLIPEELPLPVIVGAAEPAR